MKTIALVIFLLCAAMAACSVSNYYDHKSETEFPEP